MSFDTLSPRLQPAAAAALRYFSAEFGRTGLKINEGISSTIPWRPTFYIRPSKNHIIAVEVEEVIYPQILKIAARDLLDAPTPVSSYVVCPLATYLADSKQQQVRELQSHGFGLYTVDPEGSLLKKLPCVPLLLHIPEKELLSAIGDLSPKLKVYFRKAFDIYVTDAGQGLQEAGQIVEAIIMCLAEHAVKKTWAAAKILKQKASDVIDELYGTKELKNYRAALGGARDFLKAHRNPVSHPPKNVEAAKQKIRQSKEGFLMSIRVTRNLRDAMVDLKFRVALHL